MAIFSDPTFRAVLRNELRLTVRALKLDRWASGFGGHTALVFLLCVLLHLIGWAVVAMADHTPPQTAHARAMLAVVVLFFFGFMLAGALNQCAEALLIRNDTSLLLSSPVPPQTLVLARGLVIALAVPITSVVLLFPVANMALLYGKWWLTTLYLTVPLAALLSTAIAICLVLGLARTLGGRRTVVIAQVLGICVLIASLAAFQFGPRNIERLIGHGDHEFLRSLLLWPLLDALAAIGRGSPAALLMMAVTTVCIVGAGWRWFGRGLLAGAQSAQRVPRRSRRAGTTASRGVAVPAVAARAPGLVLAVCLKEWRCVWRDPLLLSRLGLSLVYLVPALLPLLWNASSAQPGFLVFTIVFACSMLAMQLAQLTLWMDEQPELAYGSTPSLLRMLQAKMLAAAVPPLVLGVVLTALAVRATSSDAWWGLPFLAAAVFTAATLMTANVRVQARAQFGKSGGSASFDVAMILVLLVLVVAGGAAAAVSGYELGGLISAVLALLFPLRELGSIRQLCQAWKLWRDQS